MSGLQCDVININHNLSICAYYQCSKIISGKEKNPKGLMCELGESDLSHMDEHGFRCPGTPKEKQNKNAPINSGSVWF